MVHPRFSGVNPYNVRWNPPLGRTGIGTGSSIQIIASSEVCALPAVMLGVFALTLFFSASLLFLVEPMVGKLMLPLLGGTPAVWNTCMVFFQAVLLAGYGYAHATTTWLGPRKQAAAHLIVLVLPLLFFLFNGPLFVNPELIAGRESNPIPALLLVLTLSVGIPMFVVCTSALCCNNGSPAPTIRPRRTRTSFMGPVISVACSRCSAIPPSSSPTSLSGLNVLTGPSGMASWR